MRRLKRRVRVLIMFTTFKTLKPVFLGCLVVVILMISFRLALKYFQSETIQESGAMIDMTDLSSDFEGEVLGENTGELLLVTETNASLFHEPHGSTYYQPQMYNYAVKPLAPLIEVGDELLILDALAQPYFIGDISDIWYRVLHRPSGVEGWVYGRDTSARVDQNPAILQATYEGISFGDYFHLFFQDQEGNMWDFGEGMSEHEYGDIVLFDEEFIDSDDAVNSALLGKSFEITWQMERHEVSCCEGEYDLVQREIPVIQSLVLVEED